MFTPRPTTLRRACTQALVTVLFFGTVVRGCGPGATTGHTSVVTNREPFTLRQYEPAVSETSREASGPPLGRIRRNSDEFRQFVEVHNTFVMVKDEEGTGADRIMTPRCKQKLDTLAFMTRGEWPELYLRVVEAWDEDGTHATQSLHYEGRAVDITTSDRDRAKYGMLARLAVEAGFDWVFFEGETHVHCSVKAETEARSEFVGCFPGNAWVLAPDGRHQQMSEVRPGDTVLTLDSDRNIIETKVLFLMDFNPTAVATFYRIRTMNPDRNLTLTARHLIYKSNSSSKLGEKSVGFASDLRVGEFVYSASTLHSEVYLSEIINIEVIIERGIFAPLTSEGTVLVNGVLTSCYAALASDRLAHVAMSPIRLGYMLCGEYCHGSSPVEGVHWYPHALQRVASYILPETVLSSSIT